MSAENKNIDKNEFESSAAFGGAESIPGFAPYKLLLSRMNEHGPVARMRSEIKLPDFNPAWLNQEPSLVVSAEALEVEQAHGAADAVASSGYKRYYSIAAMLLISLMAGVFYFRDTMGLGGAGDEILRLKNGAIVRGIVLERVGNELTVQTRDGIFRINAREGAGIEYSAHRHVPHAEDAHGNEIIFLKNGAIVRGEVRERVGGKLIVDTEDGSFQINSGELRAITYTARNDHEH